MQAVLLLRLKRLARQRLLRLTLLRLPQLLPRLAAHQAPWGLLVDLSNVIISSNQIEGIHFQGACTLTNVWWSVVCKDAFTIKLQDAGATAKISGGGAFGATDKVLQHNSAGTMSMSDFTVGTFGKLYRAYGNCKNLYERYVIKDGITTLNGDLLAEINSNFGDTATITNTKATRVKEICTRFKGVASRSEPTEIGSGADGTNCIFGSDVFSS